MKTITNNMDYGNHIILDLYECNESKLYFSTNNILQYLDYIIKSNNGTVISYNFHTFPNNAYTICFLLSESHLSIHTFPENKYVSVDVYTCGTNVLTFNIATNIIQYFESKEPKINHIIRNNFNNMPELKYNVNDYIIKKDDSMILLSNVKIISNENNMVILIDGNNTIFQHKQTSPLFLLET
jgi:S-adenosylmethionine decarboxylase